MTRDEARMLLEGDKQLLVSNYWRFSATHMSCGEGCCDDEFEDIEDVLDDIDEMCGGDWTKVTLAE